MNKQYIIDRLNQIMEISGQKATESNVGYIFAKCEDLITYVHANGDFSDKVRALSNGDTVDADGGITRNNIGVTGGVKAEETDTFIMERKTWNRFLSDRRIMQGESQEILLMVEVIKMVRHYRDTNGIGDYHCSLLLTALRELDVYQAKASSEDKTGDDYSSNDEDTIKLNTDYWLNIKADMVKIQDDNKELFDTVERQQDLINKVRAETIELREYKAKHKMHVANIIEEAAGELKEEVTLLRELYKYANNYFDPRNEENQYPRLLKAIHNLDVFNNPEFNNGHDGDNEELTVWSEAGENDRLMAENKALQEEITLLRKVAEDSRIHRGHVSTSNYRYLTKSLDALDEFNKEQGNDNYSK